jgi:hypothetical protein
MLGINTLAVILTRMRGESEYSASIHSIFIRTFAAETALGLALHCAIGVMTEKLKKWTFVAMWSNGAQLADEVAHLAEKGDTDDHIVSKQRTQKHHRVILHGHSTTVANHFILKNCNASSDARQLEVFPEE